MALLLTVLGLVSPSIALIPGPPFARHTNVPVDQEAGLVESVPTWAEARRPRSLVRLLRRLLCGSCGRTIGVTVQPPISTIRATHL
jgi:hypothetical protein